MDKIKKTSRIISALCVIAIVLMPIAQAVGWLFFDAINASYIIRGFNPAHIPLDKLPVTSPLPPSLLVIGFLVSMIPTLIIMMSVYFLHKLFHLYANGQIFTKANANYIKKIGYTILIGQLFGPFYEAAMSVILTIHNPVGQRILTISFSGMTVGFIIIAVMIITISWIMDQARQLQENEALTI